MRVYLSILLLLLAAPLCAAPNSSLQAAFDLGNHLSLAVLGRAGGADAAVTGRMHKGAERAARMLKVSLPPEPALTGDKPKDLAAGLHYLLTETAPILKKMTHRQAALYEIAVKSNMLLMLYRPGQDMGLVKVLHDRSVPAKIKDVTGPLGEAVKAKAAQATFGQLVEKFQADVRAQL